MKILITLVLLFVVMMGIGWTKPALAGDIENGAKIFSANCAACHAGGKNVVNKDKTLSKADLESNKMYDLEAIKTQVTKGKNAMPAFGGRISASGIEDVASYVLAQADKGW